MYRPGVSIVLLLAACQGGAADRLLVGATHTVEDSGLLEVLLAAYDSANPGGRVRAIVAGSGEILQYGRRRDLDVLLVHAPRAERDFMEEGHGTDRRPVMWNEFLLLAPPADPAGARDAAGIVEAFRRIAASGSRFVSRGDFSGTHERELELWDSAGTRPAPDAHVEAGTGMADALRVASRQQAYILADLATFTVLRPELDLVVASRGDPLLLNVYSVILVEGTRHPEAAHRFTDWLGSAAAQVRIAAFGAAAGGPQLFHPGRPPAGPAR